MPINIEIIVFVFFCFSSINILAQTPYFYHIDFFFRSKTVIILNIWVFKGFLEQGLLVQDIPKIRKLYFKSNQFKMDLISIAPLDHIVSIISLRPFPILRFNRIIRYPRFADFIERTETRWNSIVLFPKFFCRSYVKLHKVKLYNLYIKWKFCDYMISIQSNI